MSTEKWYPRLADIPGLRFAASPGVDRRGLSGVNVRPRVGDGYLSWPSGDGSTSASPAQQQMGVDRSHMTLTALLQHTWEAVEFPGTAMDYHFILQSAVAELWRRRRDDPAGLAVLETFAALDLALAEADPAAVSLAGDPSDSVVVTSVLTWRKMLEREGALHDALELARRAARFGQGGEAVARLEDKLSALEAESA